MMIDSKWPNALLFLGYWLPSSESFTLETYLSRSRLYGLKSSLGSLITLPSGPGSSNRTALLRLGCSSLDLLLMVVGGGGGRGRGGRGGGARGAAARGPGRGGGGAGPTGGR